MMILPFTAIMSTAVTMSAAVAHLMEMPAKLLYEPALYARLHRTLYPTFGKTAGFAEAVSVATTALYAGRSRRRQPGGLPLAVTAAACMSAAHAVFWTVVQPANRTIGSWALDNIPLEWEGWRDRWEYGHAARAVLITGALSALTLSVLKRRRPAESDQAAFF